RCGRPPPPHPLLSQGVVWSCFSPPLRACLEPPLLFLAFLSFPSPPLSLARSAPPLIDHVCISKRPGHSPRRLQSRRPGRNRRLRLWRAPVRISLHGLFAYRAARLGRSPAQ